MQRAMSFMIYHKKINGLGKHTVGFNMPLTPGEVVQKYIHIGTRGLVGSVIVATHRSNHRAK